MANTRNAKTTLPYVQRLIEDEYVQEQLREAAAGLRNAYERATRKNAQAAEDKKLYANLRRGATSVQNAVIALRRPPEPPPTHRGRNVVVIAVAIGATVVITRIAQKQNEKVAADVGLSSSGDGVTVAAPPPPDSTVSPQ